MEGGAEKRRSLLADSALLSVAIIWGLNFVIIKDAIADTGPMTYLLWRHVAAAMMLAAVMPRTVRETTRRDWLYGAVLGLFLFIGLATQTIGLQWTTPGKSGFITSLYIVMVPFLYWIVARRSPGWTQVGGAVLATVGLGLLSLRGGFGMSKGDLLTLVGALGFAAQIAATGFFAPRPARSAGAHADRRGGVLFVVVTPFVEHITWDFGWQGWAAIFWTALSGTVFGFLVQAWAQKSTTSTRAAVILGLEGLFAAAFGLMFGMDVLNWRFIAGAVLILAGVIVIETLPGRRGEFNPADVLRAPTDPRTPRRPPRARPFPSGGPAGTLGLQRLDHTRVGGRVDWDWDDGPPQDTPKGAPRDDPRLPDETPPDDAPDSPTFADAIEHFDRSTPPPDDDERTQVIRMPGGRRRSGVGRSSAFSCRSRAASAEDHRGRPARDGGERGRVLRGPGFVVQAPGAAASGPRRGASTPPQADPAAAARRAGRDRRHHRLDRGARRARLRRHQEPDRPDPQDLDRRALHAGGRPAAAHGGRGGGLAPAGSHGAAVVTSPRARRGPGHTGAAALCVVVAAALAGCGGKTSADSQTQQSGPPPSPAPGVLAWAAGEQGDVLGTRDGGAHWTRWSFFLHETGVDVDFSDAATGWLATDAGTVLRSTDSGKDLEGDQGVLAAGQGARRRRRRPRLGGLQRDGAAGEPTGSYVFRTSDGGATWERAGFGGAQLADVSFADARHGVLVALDRIWTTSDGGGNWVLRRSIPLTVLEQVATGDPRHAWSWGGARRRASASSSRRATKDALGAAELEAPGRRATSSRGDRLLRPRPAYG